MEVRDWQHSDPQAHSGPLLLCRVWAPLLHLRVALVGPVRFRPLRRYQRRWVAEITNLWSVAYTDGTNDEWRESCRFNDRVESSGRSYLSLQCLHSPLCRHLFVVFRITSPFTALETTWVNIEV